MTTSLFPCTAGYAYRWNAFPFTERPSCVYQRVPEPVFGRFAVDDAAVTHWRTERLTTIPVTSNYRREDGCLSPV